MKNVYGEVIQNPLQYQLDYNYRRNINRELCDFCYLVEREVYSILYWVTDGIKSNLRDLI